MAYDPQYAHEYYMKHRKLKGRKRGTGQQDSSTPRKQSMMGRGLDKEQRAELTAYWNDLKDGLAEEKENIKEAKEHAIDSMNKALTAKIDWLKDQMKGQVQTSIKDMIREKIAQLRQTKKDTRAHLVQISKDAYASEKKKVYDDYNAKLNSMKPKEKPEKSKKSKKGKKG